MILLDTHIWIWWLTQSSRLTKEQVAFLNVRAPGGFAVSAISLWETATLHALNRLSFTVDLRTWLTTAADHPQVTILPISAEIAVESANLPQPFHRDPADRILDPEPGRLAAALAIAGGPDAGLPAADPAHRARRSGRRRISGPRCKSR